MYRVMLKHARVKVTRRKENNKGSRRIPTNEKISYLNKQAISTVCSYIFIIVLKPSKELGSLRMEFHSLILSTDSSVKLGQSEPLLKIFVLTLGLFKLGIMASTSLFGLSQIMFLCFCFLPCFAQILSTRVLNSLIDTLKYDLSLKFQEF